jgi:hypothetical protein
MSAEKVNVKIVDAKGLEVFSRVLDSSLTVGGLKECVQAEYIPAGK